MRPSKLLQDLCYVIEAAARKPRFLEDIRCVWNPRFMHKSVEVRHIEILGRFHYNGDSFWDGDQTLHEVEVVQGEHGERVLVVVPRGNAFISPEQVTRSIEGLGVGLAELKSACFDPGPGRRRQLDLWIEPGDGDVRVIPHD